MNLAHLSSMLRGFFIAMISLASLMPVDIHAQATPQSGYWWNPAEGGRGYFIEIQDQAMFFAAFMYGANGQPTWLASEGAMTSTTQYSGMLQSYANGQTLTGIYNSPIVSNPQVGEVQITFTSDTTANLTWPGGVVPIQRFAFGPGDAGNIGGINGPKILTNMETGFYWNPVEGGRGFTIEMQNDTVYLAGFMYGSDGSPIWYLSVGNRSNVPTIYFGSWTQYKNGQTLTGTYQSPVVANTNVGQVTLQFPTPITATLTLPNSNQIPLNRFNFSSVGNPAAPNTPYFSCANTAPTDILTVGNYSFNNNPWGIASSQFGVQIPIDFTQCIYVTPTSSGISAYWNWDWPSGVANGFGVIDGIKSAPNIEWRPNGLPFAPIMLSDLGNLTEHFDYSVNANGIYDVNMQFSINSVPPPAGTEVDFIHNDVEIFILLEETSWINPNIVDTVTIDGNQFSVVASLNQTGSSNSQIVFQNLQPITKGALKVKDFTDYTTSKGWTNASQYVDLISFGAELYSGTGSFTLNSFNVSH